MKVWLSDICLRHYDYSRDGEVLHVKVNGKLYEAFLPLYQIKMAYKPPLEVSPGVFDPQAPEIDYSDLEWTEV